MRSLLKMLFDLVKVETLRGTHKEETTCHYDLFGQSFEFRAEKERREAIEKKILGSVISIKISILVVFKT